LPAQTTTHWHGIALRNSADGVPGLTQKAVESGGSFQYDFVPSDPGTYFYHPHVGVQLDRGLYAPLLIDDPSETGDYDVEWVVVLDDWIDGTGTTPDEVLANLIRASSSSGSMDGMNMSGMAGMSMGASDPVFGDAGDVKYPYYLVNGRVSSAPNVLRAKPGQRVRIRLINAAADTIFAVALGEHKMSLTHTDGFRVTPTSTDALYIGMGERYDAVVTVKDGVFPLIAKPVGKTGQAMALIRTGGGQAPAAGVNLPAFSRTILLGSDLTPDDTARLPRRAADQTIDLVLGGQMSPYSWAINGAPYPKNKPITITKGNRVTVRLRNRTMMTHPLHIHGHTFALPNGLRKDTVLLKPMQKMDVELQANNPGNWMAHCHNIYHGEAGMMAALVYR
jgi:FtsP/CotA-like multicopper oxidase with cupredoxin domain